MKKKNPTQEYGKPYTAKDFRQVGIGMIISGIIVSIFGISAFQHGWGNQIVLTKGGNEMHGSDPSNPLFLIVTIFGGALIITGCFFRRRGKKTEK